MVELDTDNLIGTDKCRHPIPLCTLKHKLRTCWQIIPGTLY